VLDNIFSMTHAGILRYIIEIVLAMHRDISNLRFRMIMNTQDLAMAKVIFTKNPSVVLTSKTNCGRTWMEPMAFIGFGKTTLAGIVKPSVTGWNDIVSRGFACVPHIANIRPSHITRTCHQATFQQLQRCSMVTLHYHTSHTNRSATTYEPDGPPLVVYPISSSPHFRLLPVRRSGIAAFSTCSSRVCRRELWQAEMGLLVNP